MTFWELPCHAGQGLGTASLAYQHLFLRNPSTLPCQGVHRQGPCLVV